MKPIWIVIVVALAGCSPEPEGTFVLEPDSDLLEAREEIIPPEYRTDPQLSAAVLQGYALGVKYTLRKESGSLEFWPEFRNYGIVEGDMQLAWVHGFESGARDTRNALRETRDATIRSLENLEAE